MPRKRRVQMKNHRHAQFATVLKEPDRVGIVIAHAAFEFTEDASPEDLRGGLEFLVGVRVVGVHGGPGNEPAGIALCNVDDITEGDAHAGGIGR